MSDPAITDAATTALARWPIAEGFFIIVITFLTGMAWFRGERNGKKMSMPNDMPLEMYLMARDASKSVIEMQEGQEKANAILADIARQTSAFNEGNRLTHKLLEDIRNNHELQIPAIHSKRGS